MQARRRAGLKSFPGSPPEESACPASDRQSLYAADHSQSPVPSDALLVRSSARQTPGASGNSFRLIAGGASNLLIAPFQAQSPLLRVPLAFATPLLQVSQPFDKIEFQTVSTPVYISNPKQTNISVSADFAVRLD